MDETTADIGANSLHWIASRASRRASSVFRADILPFLFTLKLPNIQPTN